MPDKIQPKPAGHPALTPYLIVRNAARALEFYKAVFGAVPRMQLDGPGGRIGHAELAIDDLLIMLADEAPEHGAVAPVSGQTSPVSLHLYVADADTVVRAAEAAGATVVRPVEMQFYGDRRGTFADPFGHVWHVATHVEDVAPQEIASRAAAMASSSSS